MKKNLFSTKTLVRVAVLVAMSVVLKSFLSIETQIIRFTFFDIPLMILGIVAGPVAGLVGGFVTDWMHVMFSPFAFSFNLFTVSTMLWGFIPGLFFIRRKVTVKTLVFVVVITSLLAFTLNTYQLFLWYGDGIYAALPMRIATMVIKLPVQVWIVKVLMNALYQFDEELFPRTAEETY